MNDCFGSIRLTQREFFQSWKVEKKYDLVLTTLSWEQRATFSFLSQDGGIEHAVALRFRSATESIDARKDAQLCCLRSKIDCVEELRLDAAVDVEQNFERFRKYIEELYSKAGKPLKVLMDISCLPKNYLLFFIGIGFSYDYFACLDCVYSAGHYDLNRTSDSATQEPDRIHRALVSSGDWTSRQIPFLGSTSVFPSSRDLIVSMGGEIGLAVPFVTRAEPDKLSLAFIAETAPSDTSQMLKSERLAYRSLLSEPGVTETKFSLGDALGAANYFIATAGNSGAECVSIMVLGSKSHALGAGVAGLACETSR